MVVTALVIDDSAMMRRMIIRNLTDSGVIEFEFDEASDGVSGLEKAKTTLPDVVFVDWNMPRMTGIDFVKKFREAYGTRTPVVMITTEASMDRISQALAGGGVDAYVTKPFTVEDLQRELKPLLGRMVA
jgi:two-component system, chemotaxis family, chemotaxis protein CheY